LSPRPGIRRSRFWCGALTWRKERQRMEPRHTDTRKAARPHVFKARGYTGTGVWSWHVEDRDSGQGAGAATFRSRKAPP
jgi:hypothetical protein